MPGVGQWREILDVRGRDHQFFPPDVGKYIVLVVGVLTEYVIGVLARYRSFRRNSAVRGSRFASMKKPPSASTLRPVE